MVEAENFSDHPRNVAEYFRAVQVTEDMHFAGWMTRATDTDSEFEIIIAFLRQQW
jgi:hypothetical protein